MPETAVDIPCGDIVLEGRLTAPEGGGPFAAVVVCHPHPQYGGDMHNNVVSAVVAGLAERGLAALRFNFRGTGRSEGAHDGGRGERDDVRAALARVATLPGVDGARLGLAGYSFGASMAAAVGAEGPARALALVALPLRNAGEQAEALTPFGGPLLLTTGDSDDICPVEGVEELASALGERVQVEIIPNTDHFWLGHERELATRVGEFFARHL